MAADWLGINSSHLMAGGAGVAFCYEEAAGQVAGALGGTNLWECYTTHTHFFIVDLGQTYNVQKVRGRSYSSDDPIDLNIYVSDNIEAWGAAVASGISTWQDKSDYAWVEVDTTDKSGRFVKVEIIDTEDASWNHLNFGLYSYPDYYPIFDVYGEATQDVTVKPATLAMTATLHAPTVVVDYITVTPATLAMTATLHGVGSVYTTGPLRSESELAGMVSRAVPRIPEKDMGRAIKKILDQHYQDIQTLFAMTTDVDRYEQLQRKNESS